MDFCILDLYILNTEHKIWYVKHITCVELQHYVVLIVGCVDPDGFDSCSLLSFGLNNEDYIIVESIHLGSVN